MIEKLIEKYKKSIENLERVTKDHNSGVMDLTIKYDEKDEAKNKLIMALGIETLKKLNIKDKQ